MSVRGSTHKIKIPATVTFEVTGPDSLALYCNDALQDGITIPRTKEAKAECLGALKTGSCFPSEWGEVV